MVLTFQLVNPMVHAPVVAWVGQSVLAQNLERSCLIIPSRVEGLLPVLETEVPLADQTGGTLRVLVAAAVHLFAVRAFRYRLLFQCLFLNRKSFRTG